MLELPPPRLLSDWVRIRVTVSGVSFTDIDQRRGSWRTWIDGAEPIVPGREVAGVIESVGEAVRDLRVGQRVCAICPRGGYGELVTVPHQCVLPLPDEITDIVGGTFLLNGLVAWHLLHTVANVQGGEIILVHAAAGGVGVMLSQLAKRCGVTVIGTVGSDAKAETASLYGADHVVNYERCADWSAKVLLDLTGGSGVDVVFDGVGAKTAQGSILATHRLGQVVFFGSSSGQPRVSFPDLRTKSLRVSAFELFHMLERKQEWNRAITELASLVKRGLLEPFVTETYSWNEAAVAHKRIEARATRGKTALIHG